MNIDRIENRCFFITITILANTVTWYGGILRRIESIYSAPFADFDKFTLRFFFFPIFEFHYFLSKFVIKLQHFLMLRLHHQNMALCGDDRLG